MVRITTRSTRSTRKIGVVASSDAQTLATFTDRPGITILSSDDELAAAVCLAVGSDAEPVLVGDPVGAAHRLAARHGAHLEP